MSAWAVTTLQFDVLPWVLQVFGLVNMAKMVKSTKAQSQVELTNQQTARMPWIINGNTFRNVRPRQTTLSNAVVLPAAQETHVRSQ